MKTGIFNSTHVNQLIKLEYQIEKEFIDCIGLNLMWTEMIKTFN